MRLVLLALIPALVLHVYWMGFGIVVQLALAAVTASVLEIAVAKARRRAWRAQIGDLSILVLAALFVIAVPPYVPFWYTVVGITAAALIGKHAFGGLGNNLFNPAMVGYAFVLIAFPAESQRWPELAANAEFVGPLGSLALIFAPSAQVDAISGATALDYERTQLALAMMRSEMAGRTVYGALGARGWEWINLAYLAGGLWLCVIRVVPWRLPLAVIVGFVLPALVMSMANSDLYAGTLFHLLSGAVLPAAFFIATDPVSSPAGPRAMLIFGAGVGLLIYVIRVWGPYPDGVAFAILIMNAFVPLIEWVCMPLAYGRRNKVESTG